MSSPPGASANLRAWVICGSQRTLRTAPCSSEAALLSPAKEHQRIPARLRGARRARQRRFLSRRCGALCARQLMGSSTASSSMLPAVQRAILVRLVHASCKFLRHYSNGWEVIVGCHAYFAGVCQTCAAGRPGSTASQHWRSLHLDATF